MKKLMLLAVLLSALLSTSAFAFIPQMSFYVNREVAVTRVWNTTNRPFVCSGYAIGTTYSRIQLSAWFSNLYVAPGMSADAYVYSNYYDPFVNASAEVNCQFTW
ncbi:MAG: hypothetical protein WC635_02145 [Bacteriovorax sp.]|jgi:hypothetical protein